MSGAASRTGGGSFGTVLGFEVRRTLRKRSFWIGALAIPFLVIVVGVLQFFSSSQATDTAASQGDTPIAFAYLDESGVVDPAIAERMGGTAIGPDEDGVAMVRSGQVQAFLRIPADLVHDPVEAAGAHEGVFADDRYAAIATALLQASAEARAASPQLVAVLGGQVAVDTTTYLADGTVSTAAQALPVGIVLLVLLFLTVVVLGNPILVATSEEKENRVAEILLVTTPPRTVITAKLLALAVVGVVQTVVVALVAVLGWLAFRRSLDFGAFDLSRIVLDPQMVLLGLLLLAGAAALFIATLAVVGASAPSAREAGGFTGAAIMLPLIPLYLFALIISKPESTIVQVLTWIPFTAGTTGLVRNAFGVLPLWQGLAVAAILFATAAVMVWVAIRAFQRGALEYGRMLSLRDLLR